MVRKHTGAQHVEKTFWYNTALQWHAQYRYEPYSGETREVAPRDSGEWKHWNGNHRRLYVSDVASDVNLIKSENETKNESILVFIRSTNSESVIDILGAVSNDSADERIYKNAHRGKVLSTSHCFTFTVCEYVPVSGNVMDMTKVLYESGDVWSYSYRYSCKHFVCSTKQWRTGTFILTPSRQHTAESRTKDATVASCTKPAAT